MHIISCTKGLISWGQALGMQKHAYRLPELVGGPGWWDSKKGSGIHKNLKTRRWWEAVFQAQKVASSF